MDDWPHDTEGQINVKLTDEHKQRLVAAYEEANNWAEALRISSMDGIICRENRLANNDDADDD